jgi:hypothetical protein
VQVDWRGPAITAKHTAGREEQAASVSSNMMMMMSNSRKVQYSTAQHIV